MQRLIQKGLVAIAIACGLAATAQEPGQQMVVRGQMGGMQRVAGTVTAVTGDAVTVKAEDGVVYQVTTTSNTRLMKGQGVPLKVADLKPGDGVMAAGNMDVPNKTLHAAFLVAIDAEQAKKARENLGKTFIMGKVTAIDSDNLKMTVMRQDGVAQTIGFDETTSFKRGARGRGTMTFTMGGDGAGAPPAAPSEGGESITLADIKVGDNVMGQGSLKSGVFVPSQLNVTTPRPPRVNGGPGGTGAPGTSTAPKP